MSDISILARLVGGITRNTNVQNNTLVVGSLKVGSASPTELTKAILDRLISTQDGSDLGTGYHTHNTQYFTESELGSSSASSGSDLIGDDNTYSNFTPSAATVKGALAGIDSALATSAYTNEMAQDAVGGILTDSSTVDFTYNDAGNTITAAVIQGGLDHGSIGGLADDDHTQYILVAGTRAFTGNQSAGGFKFTSLAAGSGAGDSVRFEQVILRDGSQAFTANQAMGGFKLTGLAAGSGAGDSVRYEQAILTSGANAFAAAQSMGGFKLTSLADGTAASDAINKGQLDAALNGLKPKAAARAATTANIVIATALNSGDVIDGVTLANGDRVLVKDQAASEENGIYVVGASPARSADFDSVSPIDEINGAMVPIEEGTANAGKIFVQSGAAIATVGTDPIAFVYFNSISNLVGGDGITISGTNVSVDHDGEGLTFASAQLALELDGSTLSKSSSGVKVATGGINNNEINAAAAIAYSKLNLSASIVNADVASGAAIAYAKLALSASIVNADIASGAAIAYSKLALSNSIVAGDLTSDSVTTAKILNANVTEAKLSASVAGAGLTGGAGSALAVGAADASITVAADAISVAKDAAGAIGLSGSGIKANVDGTTIQISGNNLAVKADGIRDLYDTFTNNTGSAIAAGSVVIASQTVAGEIVLADADALATCEGVLGVVVSSIADGASGKVQVAGRCTPVQDAAYDLGKRVYVSQTAGSTTKTAPSATNSVMFLMGVAVSTTQIMLGMHLEAVNEA
jgi:hypothetical protein